MNLNDSKAIESTVVTLLSNGSGKFYKNNTLTSFCNELQKTIYLDHVKYHYIALQEVGINLNSLNVNVPDHKPCIIYFQWNWDLFSTINSDLSFELMGFSTLEEKKLKN